MGGKIILNGIEYSGGGSGGGGSVEDVEVNGTSVVNDGVAEITSYKEVTLSEYNALPSSKLTDGIAYFIEDTSGPDSFPPLIYSDEEREVGVWRNGKPLYQKTLTGTFNNATTNQILELTNETIVKADGYLMLNDGSGNTIQLGAYLLNNYYCGWYVYSGSLYIFCSSGFANADYAIVISYTKSTDIAGSGIWTTQGTYTHHFSNNEQIIGTWTDGKPLYEKTISDTTTRNTGSNTISTGISNLETLVDLKGTISYGSNVTWLPIPLSDDPGSSMSNSQIKFSGLNKNNGNITFYIGTDFKDTNVVNKIYITIQYTKTTD